MSGNYSSYSSGATTCATEDFYSLNFTTLQVYLGSRYDQKLCGWMRDVKFLPGVRFSQLSTSARKAIMFSSANFIPLVLFNIEEVNGNYLVDSAGGNNINLTNVLLAPQLQYG